MTTMKEELDIDKMMLGLGFNNQLIIYQNLHFPSKSSIDANAILIFVYMQYNNVDSMTGDSFH